MLSQHKETGGSMMPPQQLQEAGGPLGSSRHINSPLSKSKQKRPAVTALQNHSAAKRVKKCPTTRDPNAKHRRASASQKHLKSPPTKLVPSPVVGVQVRTPVITRSPMLRLLVSPVVMGVRSPTPLVKMHSPKYPTLARMARDVLAVPASTVASKSSFSTSSRVISDYRSSLSTSTVEALMCLQVWFRAAGSSYSFILSSTNLDGDEEDIDL